VNLPAAERLRGFALDGERALLLAQLSPNGTLEAALARRDAGGAVPPGPTELAKCVFGVAFTMAQFHGRRAVHRALSPAAVFLDAAFEPVLGRLCTATLVTDPSRLLTQIGIQALMAPEMLDSDGPYTNAVDVYSFGFLVYRLLPDVKAEWNAFFTSARTVVNIRRRILKGERPARPDAVPEPLWALITDC
jgi:serine/threonine-protein kinase